MTDAVRRASADDAPACAAILNTWIDTTAWMPRNIDAGAVVDILRDGLPKREAYVIGDPVAGYLSLDPAAAHIWGFYVRDTGKGLGRALLAQAKAGRSYLRLNTHLPNTRAQRFYAREGFRRTGEPWRGDDGIDEITMEWHG